VAGDAYSSLQLLHQRQQAQETCPAASDDDDGGGSKVWDPAKLLGSVLQQVDVQNHA
jgi:hypothetical protein